MRTNGDAAREECPALLKAEGVPPAHPEFFLFREVRRQAGEARGRAKTSPRLRQIRRWRTAERYPLMVL